MKSAALSFVALVSVAWNAPVLAQEDPHAGCAAPPAFVPAELLERPVVLRTGVGNSHDAVTTKSKDAQALYDQGLNYLESYVWIEASRSFHEALRRDPNVAMAYVGLSRVASGLGQDEAAARFLERAKALSAGVSPREQRRIALREKQLEAMADLDNVAKHAAYKKAIDEALTKDMEDPELWIIRGNAEEANASGRGQRGNASSVAFYREVLRLVPDHASAHHYLIHSYEVVGRIDKALEHGEAYAGLAPSIPHAAHMWGHDLRRVGRVDEAIVQFRKADALERAYFAAEKIDPSMDWHHGHNLDLLGMCYQHKGQMALAESTLREASALVAMDAYGAFRRRELPHFLIERGRFEEGLRAAQELARSEYVEARTVAHALAGRAQLGLSRVEDAKRSLEAARKELEQCPRVAPGVAPTQAAVRPWVEGLEGELLLRTREREKGRSILEGVAVSLRGAVSPDAWILGLFRLESMARTAREAGDWDLAELMARHMLEHDAAYGGSHLAMGLVYQHRGEASKAEKAFEEARRYWKDADPGLPELAMIEKRNAASSR